MLAFSMFGLASRAQSVQETFSNDPVLNGRFVQLTNSTESTFTFNGTAQNLTAVLDVSANPAYYLSNPFPPVTDATDASFSLRFRVDAVDDQEQPAGFIGLMTDRHVNNFGDGFLLVLSLARGIPVANADIESLDQSYGGSGVPLQMQADYLAVGRYRAALRELAIEIFTGSGVTNLVGFSTVTVPSGRSLSLNRVGIQNDGAREINTTVGSITLTVDDLAVPAIKPWQLSIVDSTVTAGTSGTTNAVFTVQLTPASSLPVTVDFATADGTAVAGADYVAQFGTLTFAPGATSTAITVPVLGSKLHKPTQTFSVLLSGAVDATLRKGTAVGTILNNVPLPLLSVGDVSGFEGNSGTTNFAFPVGLSAPSDVAVTVDYTTADGSAVQGKDYVPTFGTLTFLPGQTTNSVLVPVLGNTNAQPDRSFLVQLSGPTSAGLLKSQAVGTILDDDAAGRLFINDVTLVNGHSGTTPFVFTVGLTRPSSLPVTVEYSVTSGTAIVGTDLLAGSGTLTFAPGTLSVSLTVSVLGRNTPALDKTFYVKLSNPANATIAKATGLGVIRNDNPFPLVTLGDTSAPEGNAGTTLAVFPVALSFALDQPVTVQYSTSDGSALASRDYVAQSGTVTFAPGTTNQSIAIPILGNTLDEPNKTFSVDLSNPVLATLARGHAVGTILNDDSPPVLSVDDISLLEGNSGTTNANFTLRLSAASGYTVTVSYATADGSATAGNDYIARFGTVTFPPGTTSETVAVPVIGDPVFEPDESFVLQLSNPGHATLARTQATCTIVNDDPGPEMSINDVAVTEASAGTNALFTVTLSMPSTEAAVTANYATADGSATAGVDYVASSGTVRFAPGVTSATISVPILNDSIHEAAEIFFVNLSSPTNAVLSSAQGRGTIVDTNPPPKLFIQDAQVVEGNSGTTNLVFQVYLDNRTGFPVTAAYSTRDGTATASSGDYLAASGVVHFNPGVTNATISIAVNGDLIPEPDETLFIDLSEPINALEGNFHATGTILDDDTLRLTISDTSVTEGPAGTTTNAVFLVTLNKPTDQAVTVFYATADGTATANQDYYPTNGALAFAPGELTKTIQVTVLGDNVYEADQVFYVNLSNPTNALLARPQGVCTIQDDPNALILVPAGMSLVSEDCAPPNGAIDPGETVAVSFALVNRGNIPSTNTIATLLAGNGITPLNTRQSYGGLPAHSAPVSRTFSFRADGTCGQSLSAVLQIQNGGTNYGNVVFPFTLGTNVAGQAVCCNSADIVVAASADASQVVIGHPITYTIQVTNRGPKSASALTMTNQWRAPITVLSASSSQGTSTNLGQGVLCDLGELDAGASATIQVAVTPEQTGPLIGLFYARAAENDPNLANNTASVIVLVNPPSGLSINNVAVVEGNAGTTHAVFTVQLSPPSGRPVSVVCTTADGSALAGQDYVATQSTVSFPAGITSATFAVPVIGNTNVQTDRTFSVSLSNPVNASLAGEQTTGTGTIVDDDFPLLSIDDAVVTLPASGGSTNITFAVHLSEAVQKPASVKFATADGSSRAPGDYTAASGQLTFTPGTGATSADVTVAIPASQNGANSGTFFLNLSNAINLNLAQTQAKGSLIGSSTSALPQITISGVSVLEGDARTTTNAVFNVRLSSPSPAAVQVDYATANGTAIGGSDYVITSGTLTFPPGTTNGTITVIVNGDNIPEQDETFFVKLSNPTSNSTLAVSQAQGVILNDDYLPQLMAAGTQLLLENCQPPNRAIDPLETVTVNLGLVNHGLGPTTNLTARLLPANNVLPLSNPQTYGALAVNGPPAFSAFTFMIDGACGQTYAAELELRDGSYLVGKILFPFTLGLQSNGQYVCCASADLAITATSSPNPVVLNGELTYQITLTNRGPSAATGLLLTNKLSALAEFVSSSLGSQTCSILQGQTVCALPDLAPGQSLTVTNVYAPAALGDLFNYVLVGGREYDPAPADNLSIAANQVIPPAGLSIEDITVQAGRTNHTEAFFVRLFPPRNQTVTVDFNLRDGTAIAGTDYLPGSGRLTFSPGATNADLNVVIIGNPVGAPDKVFFANLLNPVNAPIALGQGTCTIVNDGPPALSIPDISVNVGTNASALGILTVSLSSVAQTTIAVDYYTTNGTAVAGTHYEAQHGTLIFPPGNQTASIHIPVAGNTLDQGEEYFYVQLLNARNATLARDRAVVTITDQAPADLSVSNATVLEGNIGLTNATFIVTLRKPILNTVTVDFFTSDGTALAGLDYLSTNGTLVFPPGITTNQVNVEVVSDTVYEPDKNFFLNLTNAFNAIIRNPQGVGTILNDDPVPCLSLSDLSVIKGQSGTNAALMPLHLSGPSSLPVQVQVLIPDCQGSPSGLPGLQTIAFPPGTLEQFVAIPIRGNSIKEADLSCLVVLTNATGAAVCRGQATLTIIDNNPLPGLQINDVSLPEGNSGTTPAVFTVSLLGATSQAVTVQFSTSDGTAKAGLDYVANSGVLTFTPGMTTTNLTVLIDGNLIVEPDKTFFVNLAQAVNANLIKPQGTGTILNDDSPPQNDCPSTVLLATPGDQTCFQPFSPITLTATPDVGSDQIAQMEFYSGATLIGIDTSSPFEIVWEGAPVGDYCVTARAICKSGRSVTSPPTCLGVTDSGAAIAIIRNFDDSEINALRDYLLEMGYCARVFDQAGLTADALSSYQLVIWDDLGADGLSDATVQVLQQVFSNDIPLYLIGDHLLSALNQLSAANQPVWTGLLHLNPLGRSGVPGPITFSTAIRDREPGSIITGRFGLVEDFTYTNTVALAQATFDATSLATAQGADLFVEYPNADAIDVGQARQVSQCFRVLTGDDGDASGNSKALFQNSVCWLLRCSFCDLVSLSVLPPDLPASINVGDQFTYNLEVGNNGECIASAVVLTNHVPAGLTVVSLSYSQGSAPKYDPAGQLLVWRVGSVPSGSENDAILAVTVRAIQGGQFHGDACAAANYQRGGAYHCTDLDLTIQGSGLPTAPTLGVLPTSYGLYQLKLIGDKGVNYQLQRSTDLLHWLSWTNAPGPLFYIELPNPALPSSRGTFFRALWP